MTAMKKDKKNILTIISFMICGFAMLSNSAYVSAQSKQDTINYEIKQLIDKGSSIIPVHAGAAKQYIFQAIEKAKANDEHKLLTDAYMAASECYAHEQRFDSAIIYRELYVDLIYELYLESREELLEYYDQLYSDSVDYFSKELLLTESEIKKTTEQTSRIAVTGLIIAVILVLVIVGYLFFQRQEKRKIHDKLKETNNLIIQQKEEIMLQNEQLSMLNEEIETQNNIVNDHKTSIEKKNNQLFDVLKRNDDQNKILTQNLLFAKEIQNSLLPSGRVLKNTFKDYFVIHKPREYVGGDFYWFYESPEYTFVVLADCTGHGVPGSFISVLGKTLLDKIVVDKKLYDPAKILINLHNETINALAAGQKNNYMEDLPDDGMDIAMCRFSKKTPKLTFAGAKRPLFFFSNGDFLEIKGDKYSIGSYSRQSRWKQNIKFVNHNIDLNNNSLCYLFSDGYTNQMSEDWQKIGLKTFKQLIKDNLSNSLSEQKALLEEFFDKHKKDQDQTDDVCVIGLKVS